VGNPFTFTGRELDAETGLMHFRARTYDPVQGRFKQRDPIGYVDGMKISRVFCS
jgi:RHS repeat-associated protein